MKTILFVATSMNVGGVEKALTGVLNALDPEEWDIYLDLIHPEGGFLPAIPRHVKIGCIESLRRHSLFCQNPVKGFLKYVKEGKGVTGIRMMWHYAVAKQRKSLNSFSRYITRNEHVHDMEFDVAVSFHGPGEYLDSYVADRVRARRKIGWIHFDVSRCYIKPRSILESYTRFDRIFVVSEEGKRVFDRMFPSLADRTEVMPNMVSRRTIERMGDEASPFIKENGETHVVTVGRLSDEKGQDLALEALALLRREGENVIWHFVGGGPATEKLRELAGSLGLGEAAVFHGVTLNPYAYMRLADIYMQPSRHEGYGITIQEALTFGVPVVSTDTAGARDQLAGVENAILTGFTPEAIADGVRRAMKFAHGEHLTADTVSSAYLAGRLAGENRG